MCYSLNGCAPTPPGSGWLAKVLYFPLFGHINFKDCAFLFELMVFDFVCTFRIAQEFNVFLIEKEDPHKNLPFLFCKKEGLRLFLLTLCIEIMFDF